jgi:hypothetical protein
VRNAAASMLLSPVIRSPTYSELFLHVSNAISLIFASMDVFIIKIHLNISILAKSIIIWRE